MRCCSCLSLPFVISVRPIPLFRLCCFKGAVPTDMASALLSKGLRTEGSVQRDSAHSGALSQGRGATNYNNYNNFPFPPRAPLPRPNPVFSLRPARPTNNKFS